MPPCDSGSPLLAPSVLGEGKGKEQDTALDLGGLVAWLIVGLIAGFLAGQFVRGAGFGLIGDIVVGGFLGGFLATVLGFDGSAGLKRRTLLGA